jgi:hypothetical protein
MLPIYCIQHLICWIKSCYNIYIRHQFHDILNINFHVLWNSKLQGSVLLSWFILQVILNVSIYCVDLLVPKTVRCCTRNSNFKGYKDSLAETMLHCALNQRLFILSPRRDPRASLALQAHMLLLIPWSREGILWDPVPWKMHRGGSFVYATWGTFI